MSNTLQREAASPQDTALYLSAFFDELYRAGVQQVVISPGSRSTPLAMVAYASSLECFVDVDERGAAFFALGMAKVSGRPACVICTSGTALANYYPAVLEAESSRVPLIVLSGDRPQFLQEVGAPQTCDQLKAFSNHVRRFWQMPEPRGTHEHIKYVRQIAKEAYLASGGICGDARVAFPVNGAPVHLNFPFDEPLKPDLSASGLFTVGRSVNHALPAIEGSASSSLSKVVAFRLAKLLHTHKTLVVCGEGTLGQAGLAPRLVHNMGSGVVSHHDLFDQVVNQTRSALYQFAKAFDAPLLADPLSQLRAENNPVIIDNYDNIMRGVYPEFEVVVRFGRWPISKSLTQAVGAEEPFQIVVDPCATRDFTSTTSMVVSLEPLDFVRSLLRASRAMTEADGNKEADQPQYRGSSCNNLDDYNRLANCDNDENLSGVNNFSNLDKACPYINQWIQFNEKEQKRILEAYAQPDDQFEGSYVAELIEQLPSGTLLFSGNSMSVRAVDTFYCKRDKPLTVLANRGLNGIDGTLSTAFGAAQFFDQTICLVGDLTFLHDVNALALQSEMKLRSAQGRLRPAIIVVVLNNNGGAIFDLLPQAQDNPYFERLFLTPQNLQLEHIAQGFDVPYFCASSVKDFSRSLSRVMGAPGLHIIEIKVPLQGARQRYAPYW